MFVNAAGELLVVDDQSLRKVTMAGDVTTLIPEGKFKWPTGINKSLLLDDGRILAATGNQVMLIAVDGSSSVLAGSPQAGYQDGPAETALFNSIGGMALAPTGDIFISDSGNNRIRHIRSAVSSETPPPSQADIALYAGITITGIPGRSYQIDSAPTTDGPWTEETSPPPKNLWVEISRERKKVARECPGHGSRFSTWNATPNRAAEPLRSLSSGNRKRRHPGVEMESRAGVAPTCVVLQTTAWAARPTGLKLKVRPNAASFTPEPSDK